MLDVAISTREAVADWIETSLLISGTSHFGSDQLYNLADSELGLQSPSVDAAVAVMERRGQTLGSAYPFVADAFSVGRRKSVYLSEYATMLCLTPGSVARQTVRESGIHEMGETFEAVAESALASFWGPGGNALRFGHPSVHGRPPEFNLAVIWLAEKMGVQPGSGYRNPYRNDGGVDVVAWRPFQDGRAGFPIALAQCTIQEKTFTKTTDVDVRLWASWLAMDSDPLSLLVVPGTVDRSGESWGQLTTVVMMIERMRIMELLVRGGSPSAEYSWTSETLDALCKVLGAGEL